MSLAAASRRQRPGPLAAPPSRTSRWSTPRRIRWRPDTGTLLWTSEGDVARGFGPALYESRRDGDAGARDRAAADVRGRPQRPARPEGQPGPGGPGADARRPRRLGGHGERAASRTARHPRCVRPAAPAASPGSTWPPARPARQIAYVPDAIPLRPLLPGMPADNGVSEVLMIDAHRMLVLERAYATGVGQFAAALRDRHPRRQRHPGPRRADARTITARRRRRWWPTSLRSGLSRLDNTEGLCWGPDLPDGRRMLVAVSDDNFNPLQVTQFAAFEFTDKS